MHTLQQEYGRKVHARVTDFGQHHPLGSTDRTEYGSLAHKFPVLVRQAGLIQALAFVQTRGKEAHKALLADLAQVVAGQDAGTFVDSCRKAKLKEYIWLTRQTLCALEWFKRFAQSVLKIESGMDEDMEGC